MPLSNPSVVNVVPPTSGTSTPTSVASSITAVTILAANASRKGSTIFNNSTANLSLELGSSGSATAFSVKLSAGGYYEVPFGYTGAISGIWDAVNGNALVRELT